MGTCLARWLGSADGVPAPGAEHVDHAENARERLDLLAAKTIRVAAAVICPIAWLIGRSKSIGPTTSSAWSTWRRIMRISASSRRPGLVRMA
jgi:hypothetical protein